MVFAAFAIRLFVGTRIPTVNNDAAGAYLYQAQEILRGNWKDGLGTLFPPGFPLMVAATSALGFGVEAAGKWVSALSGGLLIVPVYLLAKRRCGHDAAVIAAVLTCVHPFLVATSADALTEGPFTLVLASLAVLGLRPAPAWAVARDLLMGALFGCAYLLRPEAAGFLGVFAITSFWLGREEERGNGRMRAAVRWGGKSLLLACGFVIMSLPYLIFLRVESGHWKFSRKTMLNLIVHDVNQSGVPVDYEVARYGLTADGKMLQIETASEGDPWQFLWQSRTRLLVKYARNWALLILKTLPSVLHPIVVILVLVGLLAPASPGQRRVDLQLASWFVFPLLAYPAFWMEPRYYVPLVPIALVWAAEGMVVVGRAMARRYEALGVPVGPATAGIKMLVVAVAVIPLLFPTLGFVRTNRWDYPLEHKAAGEWLKSQGGGHSKVMNRKSFVAFYSESIPVATPYGTLEEILAYARFQQVDYLVVDERFTVPTRPGLATLMDPSAAPTGLVLVYSNREHQGCGIVVYRLARQEPSQGVQTSQSSRRTA